MAGGTRPRGGRDRPGRPEADDAHRRPGRGRRNGHAPAARAYRRAARTDRRTEGRRAITSLDFYFLTDGGQVADAVAQRLATFVDGATRSLAVVIYDLRLEDSPGNTLFNSCQAAVQGVVAVRLIFKEDRGLAIPVPPPHQMDCSFVHRLVSAG